MAENVRGPFPETDRYGISLWTDLARNRIQDPDVDGVLNVIRSVIRCIVKSTSSQYRKGANTNIKNRQEVKTIMDAHQSVVCMECGVERRSDRTWNEEFHPGCKNPSS